MAPIIVYLTTWSLLLAIPSLCFPVTTHITPYNSPEPHSGPIHARTIASGECEDLPYIFIHPLHSVPIIKRPKKVPDRVAVGLDLTRSTKEICAYTIEGGWNGKSAIAITSNVNYRRASPDTDFLRLIALSSKLGAVLQQATVDGVYWAIVEIFPHVPLGQTTDWANFFKSYDNQRQNSKGTAESSCQQFLDRIHTGVAQKVVDVVRNTGLYFRNVDYDKVWFRKDKVDDVMLYNWYLEQDPDVARIPALVERPDMADKLNPAHPNNPDGYNKLWFDEDVELLDRPSPYDPGTPQEKEKLKADYEKKLEEIYQSTLASLKQKQIQALDTKTVDANGNTITVQGLCRSTIRDSQVEQQPWTPGIRPRPPLGPGRLDSAAWKSASPSGKNLKSLKNSVQADSPANGSAGR